jgi:hypothetical protein
VQRFRFLSGRSSRRPPAVEAGRPSMGTMMKSKNLWNDQLENA